LLNNILFGVISYNRFH